LTHCFAKQVHFRLCGSGLLLDTLERIHYVLHTVRSEPYIDFRGWHYLSLKIIGKSGGFCFPPIAVRDAHTINAVWYALSASSLSLAL
jgi:hypothetical protein